MAPPQTDAHDNAAVAKKVTYGSIHSVEEEARSLIGDDNPKNERCRRFRWEKALRTCILVTLVAAALFVSVFGGPSSSPSSSLFHETKGPLSARASPMDMGVPFIHRQKDASPSAIWGDLLNRQRSPLPTNSWFLNLLSHRAAYRPDESTRVYTIPYIVDTAPADGVGDLKMAGIRVHWPVVQASATNVQMVDDWKNSVSLGVAIDLLSDTNDDNDIKELVHSRYRVVEYGDGTPLSQLGVSLQWNVTPQQRHSNNTMVGMVAPIVRGMPYVTMHYYGGVLPTLYSYNGLAESSSSAITIDQGEGPTLTCGTLQPTVIYDDTPAQDVVPVQREMRLHLINSDFVWVVFFSAPVRVRCDMSAQEDVRLRDFRLSVVSYDNNDDDPLTVRLALLDQCKTGQGTIQAHCKEKKASHSLLKDSSTTTDDYLELLRRTAPVVPQNPQVNFDYALETTEMTIDWGATTPSSPMPSEHGVGKLLMFALPHHQDLLVQNGRKDTITDTCFHTFHGRTCLVQGATWHLSIPSPSLSFQAPRPPAADLIPVLALALQTDIRYKLSNNMYRAAADTYFSGKILARLGRVVIMAKELTTLSRAYPAEVKLLYPALASDDRALFLAIQAAAKAELPSTGEIAMAFERLKRGVEIWLHSEAAEAPYVYDTSWGGLVNCGCTYVGKGDRGSCNNTFPDCPALASVNEDFGNGYYNDHHYHYGYHVFAAAVVSKFDPVWAATHFDRVMLYIRDFANPYPDDPYFVQFRQKDWYLGSSWASGIVSAENSPHGRNEESSSEAIAAYEAVALYGSVMVNVFSSSTAASGEKSQNQQARLETARLVRNSGQLLTATEVAATNRYWHVWSSKDHVNTYPAGYKQPVVGMLYDTMASFQTWFAPQAVVSYGIQLMPLTPIAEQRDKPEWAAALYPKYDQSCKEAGDFCIENGWSILQAGLCATAGNRSEAMKQALAIPAKVFDSLGGVGNSRSNTIWYIATRKPFDGSL